MPDLLFTEKVRAQNLLSILYFGLGNIIFTQLHVRFPVAKATGLKNDTLFVAKENEYTVG